MDRIRPSGLATSVAVLAGMATLRASCGGAPATARTLFDRLP